MLSKRNFQPLTTINPNALKQIRIVLADIDDTLTTDGRLTAEAYSAMEHLEDAGIAVAPVTGRSAGWCDHIARLWPVAGVVGENGALYYSYDRNANSMRRVYAQDYETRNANKRRLEAVAEKILVSVPRASISADQFTRVFDLAIDICEDVPALSRTEIAKVVDIFEKAGAIAKVSSIHVNGWFGTHDKLTMTKRFLREILSTEPGKENDTVAFIGDSPNDQPMWAYFNLSIGVANAIQYQNYLKSPPAYVTIHKGGRGFAEFTAFLLREGA